ncbi:uncharacterized protein BDW70DRAFT_154430 [Aspergillus foveolatus]|uniref:uncharacterized protein n=1 Tax=Aspergillus foveolatus TaxID=210207 RepID=UPI003CCD383C
MSSSAYSKRFELPWTASEKQRLWKLKTTGETKDLAEPGLPRQRRARGNLESAIPEKRSAAHLEDVTESAKFPRTLENADDNEVTGNGANITSDGEYPEHEGATPDDSVRYQTQRLSNPGSDFQHAAAVHSTLSSATIPGSTPTTSEPPSSLSFTPLNFIPIVQETIMQDSRSMFSQVPATCQKQTLGFMDSDESNQLECSVISSRENPHSQRTGRPDVSTHLGPPSSTGPTTVEQAQFPHPLGFSQEEEQLAAQACHSPPAPRPCSKSPRLEKASEELVSHVRTFAEDQKELSILRDSRKKVILESDEPRGKLNAEIRENEGYKNEIEDLKAELKLMKEEMRRIEEDKKRITGVYRTLKELVGFAKD